MQSTRTNLIHSLKTHCFDCVKQSCRLRVIFYLREFCSLDTDSIEFLMSRFNRCHKNVWIYYYYYYIIRYNEKNISLNIINDFFYFFIKCMQSMTMILSKHCMYVRLHVSWSKLLLYIFSLINHIDSLCKQALSIKQLLSLVLSFSRLFMFFSLYSFILNSHFLVVIQVLFKYFSIAILSILMINNVNIVFMFLNCAFALSCNCSAL